MCVYVCVTSEAQATKGEADKWNHIKSKIYNNNQN